MSTVIFTKATIRKKKIYEKFMDYPRLKKLALKIPKTSIIDFHDIHDEMIKGGPECISRSYNDHEECGCNECKYAFNLWGILASLICWEDGCYMDHIYVGNKIYLDKEAIQQDKDYYKHTRRFVYTSHMDKWLRKVLEEDFYPWKNMTWTQYDEMIKTRKLVRLKPDFITKLDIIEYLIYLKDMEIQKKYTELNETIKYLDEQLHKLEDERKRLERDLAPQVV